MLNVGSALKVLPRTGLSALQRRLEKLPIFCLTRCRNTGQLMEIHRGEEGLHPTRRRGIPDEIHRQAKIHPAQVLAMEIGARWGWDVPGADAELIEALHLKDPPRPGFSLTVVPDSGYLVMKVPPDTPGLAELKSKQFTALSQLTLILALAKCSGWRVEAQRELFGGDAPEDINPRTLACAIGALLDDLQSLLDWVVIERQIRPDVAERQQARITALRGALVSLNATIKAGFEGAAAETTQ